MKSSPPIATLALLTSLLPWILTLILVALSTGGNWAFLALALIVFTLSNCLCGVGGLTLGLLTLHRRTGVKRGIAAVILSAAELFLGLLLVVRFLL